MAKVSYLGDLRTKAVHVKSGQSIITDAPVDNEGKGEAFSPTDLVATSLASCILTIMGIVAKRENIHEDIQPGTVRDNPLTLFHLLSNDVLEVFV